jgi:hypothetical protein
VTTIQHVPSPLPLGLPATFMISRLQLVSDGISEAARRRRSRRKLKLGATGSLLSPQTQSSRETQFTLVPDFISIWKGAKGTRTLPPAATAGSEYIPCERALDQPTPSFAYRAPSSPPPSSQTTRKRFHPFAYPPSVIQFAGFDSC